MSLTLFLLLCYYNTITVMLCQQQNERQVIIISGAEIKQRILEAGLKLWQVADAFGCTDGNFSRKLRKDFSDADTEKVLNIIEELKSENK